jgi:ribosome-associated toxin RatA of RatAB toxin-antitoxin module
MPDQSPATVECTTLIAAAPAAVFDFLRQAEDFPRYMPNVLSVRVIEQGNSRALTAWETLLDGAPLNWLEEDTYEPPHRLSYRLLEGDIEHLEGEWLIEEAEGGRARLTARLAYRLGVPIIEEVLGEIVREKIRLNLEAMLRATRRRLEGR